MLDLSRHMRDALCAEGYPLWYRETGGDHSYVSWRHTLGTALEAILLPGEVSSTRDLTRCGGSPLRRGDPERARGAHRGRWIALGPDEPELLASA